MPDDVRTRALKLIYSGTTPERSRFTQDSPILPDVWVRFFDGNFEEPVDVLLTPNSDLGVDAMRRAPARERTTTLRRAVSVHTTGIAI